MGTASIGHLNSADSVVELDASGVESTSPQAGTEREGAAFSANGRRFLPVSTQLFPKVLWQP
jgi:hypothetical protein